MQPRRRRVGSSSSRPPGDVVYEDLVMPDHDMCCRETITPEELRVYDDSDEDDEAARRKYQEMLNAPRRKPVSDNHAYMLLFVLLCGVLFVVNLRSQRELAKIKSNMGYEEKKASPQMWWNSAIIYYLHPATFRDSNDDGIGDLRGILGHLDHLKYLNVTAVLLSSVSVAPDGMVGDLMNIDASLGDLSVFKTLVKQLHQRGIKLILDFPLNHSGDRHPWFLASKRGGEDNKYNSYYIWHPGKLAVGGERLPPNNWLSRYGGSAWTWDDTRQEFYLHQLDERSPDFNHRNPDLRQEMIKIFQFWTDLGVDGFSLRDVNLLFEVEELNLNEPESELPGVKPGEYDFLDHVYTDDQPEIHEYMATYRELVDAHLRTQHQRLLLTVEVEDDMMEDVRKYYETGVDAPLNPYMAHVKPDCHSHCLHETLDGWIVEVPEGRSTLWRASNPSHGRLLSRIGELYSKAYVVLQYMLPGAVVLLQGDEIGMKSDAQEKHSGHVNADNLHMETMAWDNSRLGGFTGADSLMSPLRPTSATSVQAQKSNPDSLLHVHHRLGLLKGETVLREGSMKYSITDENVFSFMRFSRMHIPYLIAVNVGLGPSNLDFSLNTGVAYGSVAFYTKGMSVERTKVYSEGERIELYELVLYPGDAIVIKLS